MQKLTVGANTHKYTSHFTDMARAGLTYARCDFNWYQIETAKGTYSWTTTDGMLTAATSAGITLAPVLAYTPQWANGVSDIYTPPTSYQDYFDFCTACVNQYASQGIHQWEIWNEPNLSDFWHDSNNASGPYAQNYALLLKGAYQAIKAADPSATVLHAGLALGTTNEDSTTHISPNIFLQRVYTAIGNSNFDKMAYHPYGWVQATMDTLYQVMVSNGDSTKPMWLTEYGNYNGTATGAMSEFDQMKYAEWTLHQAMRLPYVEGLIYYDIVDDGTTISYNEDNYGLIRADGTYKPAYAQLRLLS